MYWKDDQKFFFFYICSLCTYTVTYMARLLGGARPPCCIIGGPVAPPAPSVPTPLYRKGTLLNTNMFVVAFHMVLKYVYMKGKVNKRMDKCIFVLLKLTRD